jgi:membrane protease YdiL (CAAX protease family)
VRKVVSENHLLNSIVSIFIIVMYGVVGILGIPDTNSSADFSQVILGYYIIGILFILILTLSNFKSLKKDFCAYFKHFFKNTGKALLYLVIAVFIFAIARLVTSLIIKVEPTGDSLITSALESFPLYIVFVTVIYTPFVEEIIFRKLLSNVITNKYIFMVISASVFGYFHIMNDFSNIGEFISLFIPIAFFGVVLAYSYKKTNNIFIPIVIHLLYNSFVFLTF